jgi:predicted transcriptional regulator
MNAQSMNLVFEALASPVRRKILDVVKDQPGCSVHAVCDFFEISRVAVMKHLDLLEEANLIVSRKEGRTRELYFNPVPIQLIYDRWTTDYSALWASGMTRVKYRVESRRQGAEKKRAGQRNKPAAPKQRKRHA